uniref:Ground-like domain-containing protein n=1 Tax=Panagrellus redivivus TaxID=6233 RepID=A0A7E4UU60_PANRE
MAVPPIPTYQKPRKKKRRGCPSPMPCPFPPPDPIPPICPEPPPCNVNAGGGLSFPVDSKAGSGHSAPVPPPPPPPPPSYPTRTRSRRATTGIDPAKCNSKDLQQIMTAQITESPTTSKRNIQSFASTNLNGTFDVICSLHEFSYFATTKIYCEVQKGEVTCFAFLH